MKPSSVSDIKKELEQLSHAEIMNLCLRLIRHKKENKELADYVLFENQNKDEFIKKVKEEIDFQFSEIKNTNLYFIRKSFRKILRLTNKYCKLIGDKHAEIELIIYYCKKIKNSGLPYYKSTRVVNLYETQIRKISSLLLKVHEDLRADFMTELDSLSAPITKSAK